MNIIGISGKAGCGKDTIASYLREKYNNTWLEPFAGPLKRAASQAFGIPLENFQDRSLKENKCAPWGLSPRVLAQFFGTEMFRDTLPKLLPDIGSDFWIARMQALLSGDILTEEGAIYEETDTIIIPDVRFQNEYDWLIKRPSYIHLNVLRPAGIDGSVGIPGHSSEAGFQMLAQDNTYILINDGSKEELYEKVDDILVLAHMELFYTETITTIHSNLDS